MAIRIQHEVGGNLAGLSVTVSETLRERQGLRRQVLVLSAEGRLPGWILGSLPVVLLLYLAVTDPEHPRPLWTTAPGVGLLISGIAPTAVGAIWTAGVVRAEV